MAHSTNSLSGNMRSRLIVIFTLILAVTVGITFALFQINRPRPQDLVQVKAVTAFPSLLYLVNPFFGEESVQLLIPEGVNLHDYSSTPKDIERARAAQVFFILSEDPLPLEQIFLNTENKPILINSGNDIFWITNDHDHEDQEDAEEGHEGHEGYDPHLWMSPLQAGKIVKNFQQGLVQNFPENSIFYRARGEEFQARLQELDEEFRNTLSQCQKDRIIVSHNAFSYLSHDYDFEVLPLMDAEDTEFEVGFTPSRLIEVVETIKKSGIDYIFYTEEANFRTLLTITSDMEVSLLPLYTFENKTLLGFPKVSSASSEGYLAVMRENLLSLSQGMECQVKQ